LNPSPGLTPALFLSFTKKDKPELDLSSLNNIVGEQLSISGLNTPGFNKRKTNNYSSADEFKFDLRLKERN